MAQIILNVTLNSEAAIKQIEAIKTSFTTLAKSLNKIQPNKEITAQLKALASAYKGIAASIKATTDAEKQEQMSYRAGQKTLQARQKTLQTNNQMLKQTYKVLEEGQRTNQKYLDVQKEGLKLQKQSIKAQSKSTEELNKNSKAAEKGAKTNQSFFDTVSQMARGFMQWQIAAMLVMKPLYAIRNGIKSINDTLVETEKTVVALRRVLPENNLSNSDMANRLYDLAIQYGQTFENVSEIATNFARTGMDFNDTIKATNAALLALNVAELDATEASDGLIAVLSQFGLKAADLELVVDKINKVADRFPVTTSKMMAALQRTGAAAVNANMSLDRTLGIITALSKATGRGGQNIGTALNSLIQYSTKTSALETFSALSGDVEKVVEQFKLGGADILDIWTAVSKELDHLSDKQADLLDAYFETEEGQKLKEELGAELGDIYNDLSGVYSTANTFRKNYFIALLKNIDTAQQAAQTAASAAGYSQKENAAEMETYARRLEALKEQWKKLANDEQGILAFKKGLLDIGAALLKVVEWTGGLKTIIVALVPLMIAAFGPPMVLAIKKMAAALKEAGIAASTFSKTMLVISAAAWAISAITGATQRYEAQQEEQREEIINTAAAHSEAANQLLAYNKELQNGNLAQSERLNLQEKVLPLLSEEQNRILALTQGQDDYNKKLQTFIDLSIQNYALEKQQAAKAAKEKLDKFAKKEFTYNMGGSINVPLGEGSPLTVYENNVAHHKTEAEEYKQMIFPWLLSVVEAEVYGAKAKGEEISEQFVSELQYKLKEIVGLPETVYGQNEFEDYIIQITSGLSNVKGPVDKVTDATKKWADTLKEVNAQLKSAKSELDAQRKTAEKLLAIKEAETRLYEAQAKLAEAIRKARKDYVLGVLNDYLKGEETAATLEEKQNALIKARQELLEAQNSERTVRLWNQRAQIWEWQTRPDEEKLKTAESNVEKAVNDLNNFIKNEATQELKAAIESGTATAGNIYDILNKWLPKGEGLGEWGTDLSEKISAAIRSGQYDPSKIASAQQAVINAKQAVINAQMSLKDYYTEAMWNEVLRLTSGGNANAKQIWSLVNTWAAKGANAEDVSAIKSVLQALGISLPGWNGGGKIGKPQNPGQSMQFYDSGGILSGTGNIKGTAKDEIVLPPHIASKIVEPQSNAQFDAFVRDLGLLFGVTNRAIPPQTPIYNNTSSVSDSHNSYVVNGVPIPAAAAQKYTVAELFQNMELLPI